MLLWQCVKTLLPSDAMWREAQWFVVLQSSGSQFELPGAQKTELGKNGN